MEDNPLKMKNGRRPQKNKMEDDLKKRWEKNEEDIKKNQNLDSSLIKVQTFPVIGSAL